MQGVTVDGAELNRLVEGQTFGVIDFETEGTAYKLADSVGLAIATPAGATYVPLMPYRTEESPTKQPPMDPLVAASILRPFVRKAIILGWHTKFDLHFLKRLTGEVPPNIIDVQVGWWLLREDGEMGLKDVMSVVTDEYYPEFRDVREEAANLYREETRIQREMWVQQQKALYGRKITDARKEVASVIPMWVPKTSDIPIEILAPYCRQDVASTAWLWHYVIRPLLAKEGLLGYFYQYEMPLHRVLFDMEERGVTIDLEMIQQTHQELSEKITNLEAAIEATAGRRLNPNSTVQLRQYFFEECGFTPTKRVTKKTGLPALDDDALKILDLQYHDQTPIFRYVRDYRDLGKVRGTYCDGLLDDVYEGRIHGSFKQFGTATGRLASAEPNLQNIKKPSKDKKGINLRRIFIASPGYTLIKADLNQAELRILADRSGDKLLCDVFSRADGDLHAETMKRVEITDRRLAKTLNFGVAYGVGAKTYHDNLYFEYGIDRPIEQCAADIENYYNTYKGIRPWKNRVWEECRRKGYVESRFGRRRRLDLDVADFATRCYREREAVNALIQGDVADIIKVAMIKINAQLSGFGAFMLLQAHDELVVEAPDDVVLEAASMMQYEMENVLEHTRVPILADVELGPSWGETSKQ